jgi:carbamoyltransferase
MIILGINAFHGDASAALLVDGKLVAAVEEERFNRIKHWAGFPEHSIRYCLTAGGVGPRDLDHVAVSFNPRANLAHKVWFTLRHRPSFGSVVDRLKRQSKAASLKERLAAAAGVAPAELKARFHRVEHHLAHLASTFFCSPFERAAILSVDGMGDFVSTMFAVGEGNRVRPIFRVYYPHSVGFLYNALTLYLGFLKYGDEYKVMGLAPYGKPAYLDQFRDVIAPDGDGFRLNLDYFTHHKTGIAMSWENGEPVVEPFHSRKLEEAFGPPLKPRAELTPHHEDVASSLQAVTEEIIFHLARRLHARAPHDNLCLAGGCAMNSVANGKFLTQTPFKDLYVPAGAADNGTSFGAAFYVWNQLLGRPRSFVQEHAYWGPQADEAECLRCVESHAAEVRWQKLEGDDLCRAVIDRILEGLVVGWFRGRMEFGARALGSRSLLADPRRTDIRDVINLKIKFREKFRPFAPSVLEEAVGDWFEHPHPAPFMEQVLPIRPEKRALVPAVCHVDGSGRLQSVSRKVNPEYWALIKEFERRTGVPMLLNTSLNENEPIVCTPEEAIQCFLRTRMDAIVLGPYLVERK